MCVQADPTGRSDLGSEGAVAWFGNEKGEGGWLRINLFQEMGINYLYFVVCFYCVFYMNLCYVLLKVVF